MFFWFLFAWKQLTNDHHHATPERFSVKYRNETKTKVSTLANHKGHRQYSAPIKTRGKYMLLTQSAGKRVRVSQAWFSLLLSMVLLLIG